MYCELFGLRCKPFEDRADAQFFYTTPDREEAIAAMEYEARYGEGMALVTGEAGTGKTVLVRSILPKLPPPDRVVVLSWPANSDQHLIRETAKAFGLSLPNTNEEVRALSRIRRSLTKHCRAGHRSILIVDQAENLTEDNLAELTKLSELQHKDSKLLHIILMGQPQFRGCLEKPMGARVAQLVSGGLSLATLSPTDTKGYIKHRLTVAGASDVDLFDESSSRMIHVASDGIPRFINRICDAVMVAAYGQGTKRIEPKLVAEVVAEMDGGARSLGLTELGRGAIAAAQPTLSTPSINSESGARSASKSPNLSNGDSTSSLAADVQAGTRTSPTPAGESRRDEVGTPHPDGFHSGYPDAGIRAFGGGLAEPTGATAVLAEQASSLLATEDVAIAHTGLTEKLAQSVAQADRTLQSISDSIQQADSVIESGVAVTSPAERLVTRTVNDSLLRIEQACASAEQTQHGLRSFAEQLVQKAGAVQTHMADLLEAVHASEETCTKLSRLQQATAETSQQAGDSRRRLEHSMQEANDKAETIKEKIVTEISQATRAANDSIETTKEKIVAELSQATNAANDKVQTIKEEIVTEIGQAAKNANDKAEATREKSVAEISQATKSASDTVKTIKEEIVTEISQAAKNASDKAEATREKSVAEISQATKSANDTVKTIKEQIVAEISQVTNDANDKAETIKDRIVVEISQATKSANDAVKTIKEQIVAEISQAAKDANHKVETTKAKIVAELSQATKDASDKAETIQEKIVVEISQAAHMEHRAMLDTMLKEQRSVAQVVARSLLDSIDTSSEHARAAAAELSKSSELAMRQTDQACDRLQQSISEVDRKSEDLKDQLADELVATGRSRMEELEARIRQEQEVALEKALESHRTATTEIIQQALVKRRQLEDQLEPVQNKYEELYLNYQQKFEKASSRFQSEIEDMNRKMEASDARCRAIAAAAAKLDSSLSSAADSAETLDIQIQTNTNQLDALTERASQVTQAITQEVSRGEELCDQSRSITTRLEESHQAAIEVVNEMTNNREQAGILQQKTETAQSVVTELAGRQAEGERIAQQLASSTDTAETLANTLQTASVTAANQIGRLDSHHASASNAIQQLQEGNVEARGLVNRIEEVQQRIDGSASEVRQELQRLAEDVWSLTTRTEAMKNQLTKQNAEAEKLLSASQTAFDPARELIQSLTEHSGQAQIVVEELSKRHAEAHELTESVSSIAKLLKDLEGRESSIREITEQAARLDSRLSKTAAETATQHETVIEEWNVVTVVLTESFEQIKREAQQVTEQLSGQLSAAQDMTKKCRDAAESIPQEEGDIRKSLNELHEKVDRVKSALLKATAKPAEIIAVAQAQSDRLERVCTAVRKIFRELSKTALNAREHTHAFERSTRDAQDQLTRLTVGTDRAARTLSEWVREAICVQSRLEDTFQKAPTIAETHPASSSSCLAEPIGLPLSLSENRIGTELTQLPEPEVAPPNDPVAEPNAGSSKRAQIAKLIAEAKQVVENQS